MSEQKRDYYEILGVERSASEEEIKKAYKKKVKMYHPDLNPGDKTAEEKMKEVNEAYEVLSNADKKAQYDQFGHSGMNGGPGGGYSGGFGGDYGGFGGDFGDIFDMFFGGGGRRDSQSGPRKGADLRYDMSITFEEACFGVDKEFEINRMEECDTCHGSGAEPGSHPATCPDCGGTGRTNVVQSTPFGQFQQVRTCSRCAGKGKIIDQPCHTCNGSGQVKKKRKLKIHVPGGVDTGSRLRMQGEGERGRQGGAPGDLYIYITVRPHKTFKRDGDDVLLDFNISFVQAALGCETQVPTLDGMVKFSIPEGTQTGTVFRLRGKGFPNVRGFGRGDEHVRVQVTTPTKLTEAQKELLREFERSQGGKTDNLGVPEKKKGIFSKLFDNDDKN